MAVVCDETFCGPLCQHPSCWQSHRRCTRGLPQTKNAAVDSDSEDEGLPTQKVVNLLEDYGEDSRDRYPSKWRGRPMHERATSMANLTRAHTQESFPKVRVPNATPASPLRLMSFPGQGIGPKMIKQCEVQEVFDLDDLQSDWHETFQAKKYYIWVPNARKKTKPRTPLNPRDSFSLAQLSQGPHWLNTKDVTEDMVPEELEIQRMNGIMRQERRLDCKTPTGGQPYSYPLTQGGDYNGLYDLLDLPREVLADIVNHIEDHELKSKEQFVEAVIRTLPKLEKNHTAISLASSNVLLQRPIKLHDGDLRNIKGMEPFITKQVYQLDDKKRLDRLTTANEQPLSHRQQTERSLDVSTLVEPPSSSLSNQEATPVLNKKKPLPAIGDPPAPLVEEPKMVEDNADDDVMEEKRKVPSIALGLPTIPTGLRYTKTFTYTQQDFDFTLGRIPSPLHGLVNKPPESIPGSPGPVPSEASGQGVLAIPEAQRQDPTTPHPEDRPRENMKNSFFTDIMESLPSTPWNQHSITQMVVHMPKTPNPTPVTRQSTFITDPDTAFTPDPATTYFGMSPAPSATSHQLSIVSQRSLALTPDPAGGLHPIAETDASSNNNAKLGTTKDLGTIRHQMPRRLPHTRSYQRSVHFTPAMPGDVSNIPPQPPSSPSETEEANPPPLIPWQLSQIQAQMNNSVYQAFAREEAEGLMVIGKGTKGTGPAGSGYLQSRGGLTTIGQRPPATASTTSPEPWPQIDEQAYRYPNPRTPLSPPKSRTTEDSGNMSSDMPMRTPDGRLSYPKSAASGGSHSSFAAKRLWQEGQLDQLESPAPPPPSPEPRHSSALLAGVIPGTSAVAVTPSNKSPTKSPAAGTGIPLTIVTEGEESESEMATAAKPKTWSQPMTSGHNRSPPSMANSPKNTGEDTLANREATGMSDNAEVRRKRGEHVLWAQRGLDQQMRGTVQVQQQDQQPTTTQTSLDQFDATEDSLKKELEGEYEKLAKQQ